MPIVAELDRQREIGQLCADSPVAWLQDDDALGLQLPCMALQLSPEAAAVRLVVQRTVDNLAPLRTLLIPEMAHGGKEQGKPPPMLWNVTGFLFDLHLQDGIPRLVESVEGCGLIVELVTQYDDEMANPVR